MIVVGCGKSKRAHLSRARDLYTGTLFRAAKHYAAMSGQPWVILSGLHGVVMPDSWIAPYELRLALRGPELRLWARLAAEEIARRRALGSGPVEILAGKDYAGPIAAELEGLGVESIEPLRGLGMGKRIQKLNSMWERAVERRRALEQVDENSKRPLATSGERREPSADR